MSTIQMEGLWQFLQTLSLTSNNKQWLAEHLVMPKSVAETPNQKYVRETLTRALKDVRKAQQEGRPLGRPAEELLAELRK